MTHGNAPGSLPAFDWRFLVPRPPGSVFGTAALPGASADECAAVVARGIATRCVNVVPQERGSADVIVIRGGRSIDAAAAAACLADSGAVCIETDRRAVSAMSQTPQRVSDMLIAAGLRVIGSYAIIGPVQRPRALVPLGSIHPMNWYLDVISRVHSANTRAMEAVVRRALTIGPAAFGAICPAHVVVAVGPHARHTPAVLDGAIGMDDAELDVLLMVQGGDRVVALPFESASVNPCAAVKVPRAVELNGRTGNDQRILARLQAQLPVTLASSIPRPLGTSSIDGVTVTTESVLPGTTLLRRDGSVGLSMRAKIDDLARAANWLADIHVATRTHDAISPVELIDRAVDRFRERLGIQGEEPRLLGRARAFANTIANTRIPVVLQHRDFNPWNVLRDGDVIGVVDWEGAREGPALIDLIHFTTNWFDAVRGVTRESAKRDHYAALFFAVRTNAAGAAARDAIRAYLRRMGMSTDVFPVMLVVAWLDLAVSREEQRQAHALSGDARAENRAIPFITLLAQASDTMFEDGWWRTPAVPA